MMGETRQTYSLLSYLLERPLDSTGEVGEKALLLTGGSPDGLPPAPKAFSTVSCFGSSSV